VDVHAEKTGNTIRSNEREVTTLREIGRGHEAAVKKVMRWYTGKFRGSHEKREVKYPLRRS